MMIVWMMAAGAAIGLIASLFVVGRRGKGMPATISLGILTYGLGGLTGIVFAAPVLAQWLVAIACSVLLTTGYLLIVNWQAKHRAE